MNKTLYLLILLFSLSTLSCKTAGRAVNSKLKKRSAKYLLKKMEANVVEIKSFEAKAKIQFQDQHQKVKATAFIRHKKDSLIWIAVKKLSVEGARVLITKDSIFAINRLEKTVMAKDLSFLQDHYGLPANFDLLQAILLGNPVYFGDQKKEASIDHGQYRLDVFDEPYKSLYWLDGISYLLTQMSFSDEERQRHISMNFDAYKGLDDGQNFAYERALLMDSPDTGPISLDIKFTKIKINTDKEIKFEIPSHYTKIE